MSQIHIQQGLHVMEASEASPLPQLSHRQGPSHLHCQASWIAFDTGVTPGWAIEAPSLKPILWGKKLPSSAAEARFGKLRGVCVGVRMPEMQTL